MSSADQARPQDSSARRWTVTFAVWAAALVAFVGLATVKDGAKWRVLDLKRAAVRSAITNHTGAVLKLYKPPLAVDYK